MCCICISPKGVRQPTKAILKAMFKANPHGAGVMYTKRNRLYIRKGFMTFDEYWDFIRSADLRACDAAVYHTRIATQAGVTPEMTQPFPLSSRLEDMEKLSCTADMGVAHNGIIVITSTGNRRYSDTALYITNFMHASSLDDNQIKRDLDGSRLVILDSAGNYKTFGTFTPDDAGRLYSNMLWGYNYRYDCNPITNLRLIYRR